MASRSARKVLRPVTLERSPLLERLEDRLAPNDLFSAGLFLNSLGGTGDLAVIPEEYRISTETTGDFTQTVVVSDNLEFPIDDLLFAPEDTTSSLAEPDSLSPVQEMSDSGELGAFYSNFFTLDTNQTDQQTGDQGGAENTPSDSVDSGDSAGSGGSGDSVGSIGSGDSGTSVTPTTPSVLPGTTTDNEVPDTNVDPNVPVEEKPVLPVRLAVPAHSQSATPTATISLDASAASFAVGIVTVRIDVDLDSDGQFQDSERGVDQVTLLPGSTTSATLPELTKGQHLVFAYATDESDHIGSAIKLTDVDTDPTGKPLTFEKNQGQTDEAVDFVTRGSDYAVWLTGQGATWSANKPGGGSSAVFSMKLAGADLENSVGFDTKNSVSHYYTGDRTATSVANYGGVRYLQAYEGIDLIYTGVQGELRHDFIVAAEADYHQIRLDFSEYASASLMSDGQLELRHYATGDVNYLSAPKFFQEVDGVEVALTGRFAYNSDGTIGYEVDNYDSSKALRIDPTIAWSTFAGGSSTDNTTAGQCIQVDATGVYVIATTRSIDFPTSTGGLVNSANDDAVVFKLNLGGGLLWSTYLGGNGNDTGNAVAISQFGQVYVTGSTNQSGFTTNNFPTTVGSFHLAPQSQDNAYAAKLQTDGTLLWATYITGGNNASGNGIAVDSADNVYIVGTTVRRQGGSNQGLDTSSGSPGTANAFQESNNAIVTASSNNARLGYLAKLASTTGARIYATYLTGTSTGGFGFGNNGTTPTSVNVDATGNAYVVGHTDTDNFPVVNPIQAVRAGSRDMFVTKVNNIASNVFYSTYLGGTGDDRANTSTIDANGSIYLGGRTDSTNMQVLAGVYQPNLAGGTDGWWGHIGVAGTFITGTYLGTNNSFGFGSFSTDTINAIRVDSNGLVYVGGRTDSNTFPAINPLQVGYGGFVAFGFNRDGFVSVFTNNAAGLLFSTPYGGQDDDGVDGLALDASNNIFISGDTNSVQAAGINGNFPIVNPGLTRGTGTDVFVARLNNPDLGLPPTGGGGGGTSGSTTVFLADPFEPNQTADQASDLGVLASNTLMAFNAATGFALSLTPDTAGLPDYDWYKWTAGGDGNFSAATTVLAGGNQEVYLYKLEGNTPILVDSNSSTLTGTRAVATSVTAGTVLLLQVKGRNNTLGLQDTSLYSMQALIS